VIRHSGSVLIWLLAQLGPVCELRNARLLHPAKRPDFIGLNAAAIEVAHLVISERSAAVPDLDHKTHDRIAVCIGHSLG
jgi:hypothetical protein